MLPSSSLEETELRKIRCPEKESFVSLILTAVRQEKHLSPCLLMAKIRPLRVPRNQERKERPEVLYLPAVKTQLDLLYQDLELMASPLQECTSLLMAQFVMIQAPLFSALIIRSLLSVVLEDQEDLSHQRLMTTETFSDLTVNHSKEVMELQSRQLLARKDPPPDLMVQSSVLMVSLYSDLMANHSRRDRCTMVSHSVTTRENFWHLMASLLLDPMVSPSSLERTLLVSL